MSLPGIGSVGAAWGGFLAFPESRQASDRRTRFRFREPQLVQFLQVQPEFRAGAEEVRQAKRTVAGNRPLTVQDSGDPIGWHVELPAKLGSAHAEFLELFGEVFAGMNCTAWHGVPHLW
jgi:hypothetical protein